MRRGGKASASSSEEVEELQAGIKGELQAMENCKQASNRELQASKRELQVNKGTASK